MGPKFGGRGQRGPLRAGARRCHAPREAGPQDPFGAGCKGPRRPLAPGGQGAGPAPCINEEINTGSRSKINNILGFGVLPDGIRGGWSRDLTDRTESNQKHRV